MSLLVLGVSHHRAPLTLLESVSLGPDRRDELARRLLAGEDVAEAVVLSTCNRTEVYVEAHTFHGGVDDITDALSALTGVTRDELAEHVYIHYEDRAIAHAFSVACGLDSMAVGEAQILGQLRDALREGQDSGRVGPSLNALLQQALRVGKRAHTETEIDSVSVSLVEAGLARAERELGPLGGLCALVIGAGSMSGLAAATLSRKGIGELSVVNRTFDKGARLAERAGGRARPLAELPEALAAADLIISCTGAAGLVVDLPAAADAQVARGGRPQGYLDLALPRDIAREIDSLRGVFVAGLDELGHDLAGDAQPPEVAQVADMVVAEVADFLTARSAAAVGPTVRALRQQAAEVMASELSRLEQRLPDLDEATRAEVGLAMHRLVEKLLHTPTVRVKQLSVSAPSHDYAQLLRDLFDLSSHEAAAVAVHPRGGERLP